MSRAAEWVDFLEAVRTKEDRRPKWAPTAGAEAWATVNDYGTLEIGSLGFNAEAALSLGRWILETFGD